MEETAQSSPEKNEEVISADQENKKPVPIDNLGNVWRGYERSLKLGDFSDAGRTPTIKDVEVVVCFADLRGFTDYVHNLQKKGQDNKVQHFLRAYFPIFPKAVLRAMWVLEPDTLNEKITADDDEIKRLIIPKSYKNLGDGMMIVWELQDASRMYIQGLVTRYIYTIIEIIQELFGEITKNLIPNQIDGYSKYAESLRLGFGLAKGHAWRLEFGNKLSYDYAGSIINLAARLQGLARPEGVVAQVDFSESFFSDKVKAGEGKITEIASPKGFGEEKMSIFTSTEILLPES